MAPAEQDEPHVLAIASHVTYGYVGNKMATFVLQALGADVSAIHTVAFSNHTAYKQFKGRRTPADEIQTLYEGLQASRLADFDMLLSGYTGTPEGVAAVGTIAKELQVQNQSRPGRFFWILDPVMGDNDRLYVDAAIPPVYQSLLPYADLILPNAFEAELLTGTRITSLRALLAAIATLHTTHRVPHVVITSLRLPGATHSADELAVVGSSARADRSARPFLVRVPALPVFFSGTGDMFAALVAVRLREASAAAGLSDAASWAPPDALAPKQLPLAAATRRALQSMHAILAATMAGMSAELRGDGDGDPSDLAEHLRRTKAAEIRVPRFVDELRRPENVGIVFDVEEIAV